MLPESLIQAVFCKFSQNPVLFQLAIRKNTTGDLFKRGRFAFAQDAHHRILDDPVRIAVEFQRIKGLRAILSVKEGNVLLNRWLAALGNPQVKAQQRRPVGKKLFGLANRIRQMILTNIRLWEGSIQQIICRLILTL